ncbi:hypothetical protein MGG_17719 [Pyricularia oryzae 70-15]|uniref:Uncharacterized protein n=1 Tax=Pyricularia oryzae (strain 70-15 / ATCC MYA-4617 / FGSC 8958) TaxID=242507 RepID=G4NH17_PYRO7|nr:uncharacterized protein MGG_17719 [Pyricularia oryzae 70-15]EHA47527.1 hypothetical protein MGG_17719 [Pyricularia oryzae 70-15]KAI7932674.1 hypothetical protein M0657_000423 [Pyricularia oryzae]
MQIPPQYCRKKDRKQKRMLSKNDFRPPINAGPSQKICLAPPNSHNNNPKPIIRSKKGIHTQRCRLPPCVCERSARPLL